jgi:predicted ATPase/DNA-binding CsgD family transcriptional regulator
MIDRVGQQLGNYQLVALLGQGGYAQVYLGQHVRLPLQVAIKVLHSHLTGREAEHFQQEAETIARLAHPSIVRILDYDVQAGVPFLVMDYAPNGSLRRRYPKGMVVPPPQIVSYVKQLAAGLQYAHEQKVIHRDVKPENMLLGRHEEVLLSDFGLAALAHSSASLSTQEALGTLPYMAPEQIEGHPRAASDQYALGVVVYEWLCGSRPFEGSFSEVMVQHLSLPPPSLRERVPTIPGEVEQVVLKALAKDARQRFASVRDFALALEEASTGASIGSTRLMLATAYAAEARHTTKHHLPAHLTPLLGREQEVVEACTILRRPEVRLVTLTGPGGIGKTRLAPQVATELLADFAGGVSFVSLAPISDPELVIPTIAQTLDVKESGTLPLMDLLKAFLQDKHVLLILDNFEQLLSAAPYVADLLTSCPQLNICVTSRAVLHVQGEQEFPVPALAVPDLAQLPESENLAEYAAVALFLQRAQAVKPGFQLTSTNARPIAAICTRLDGLPLAIELAAARIKLLPPPALLTRLEHRLAVLTGGAQNLLPRQQTLRNTIEWSYHLLDTAEQRLFRRLSVFAGGCMLEAIEAVCAPLDTDAAAISVLDAVSSLIDKSLLQQTEQEGKEPRLVMLETIREYGLEALAARGEVEVARQAHAAYYLALVEAVEPELVGPAQVMWLERLEEEHDNLRAAMRWSLEQVGGDEGGQSQEMALRLGAALRRFWMIRGHISEGRSFLEQALTARRGIVTRVQVKALQAAASLAVYIDDTEQAEILCGESLRLCRELGDKAGMAFSLFYLGMLENTMGNLTAARMHTQEALALDREVGDKGGVAWSLNNLADFASYQGEYARAQALIEESLTMHRELGNKRGIASSLQHLAQVLFLSQGDPVLAHSRLQEGHALFRELGDKGNMTHCLSLSGRLALSQGDTTAGRSLLEESLRLSREIGSQWSIAESLAGLAQVEASQGELAAARMLYEQSLTIARERNYKDLLLSCMEGLADVVGVQGEPAWTARLWGAAEVLREDMGTPLPPVYCAEYERAVAATRTQLGEKAFAAAWAEGRTMTPEQALAAHGQGTIPVPASEGLVSSSPTKSSASSPVGLSSREAEVLRLVARGMTNEQVARQLGIRPSTVKTHLTSIYSKIQVSSRIAATRYAIEHQLV